MEGPQASAGVAGVLAAWGGDRMILPYLPQEWCWFAGGFIVAILARWIGVLFKKPKGEAKEFSDGA
jgi:hypothetical protein